MNHDTHRWTLQRVADVAEHVTVGFVGSMSALFTDAGVALLRGQNIRPYTLDLSNLKYISRETHRKWKKSALRAGDVAIVRVGYPGTACVIPVGLGDLNAASLVIVRPMARALDSHFFCYVLNSAWGKARIGGLLVGAAQQVLNTHSVSSLEIPLPPLAEQRRIAGILSAYNDLIENCERRIRVLDEMARALYREWFVNFCYPGHVKVPLVDSPVGRIPEGWKVTEVGGLTLGPDGVQTGPFGSQLHQYEYSEEGVPVVMPKDLRGFRVDDQDIARVPEEVAGRLGRHRMETGDIVYGRRGDIGRRAFVMDHQRGILCGTGCLRIRPDPRSVDGWYLFHHLGRDEVVGLIAGRAHGVTMPNLNTRLLATVPVFVPPRFLQDQFHERSFPLAAVRENLIARIGILRKARDLLLPRLLAGQLSLEDVAA